MRVLELNSTKAQEGMEKWKNSHTLPSLNKDYEQIRTDLQQEFCKLREQCQNNPGEKQKYVIDVLFGIALFNYMEKQSWFSLRWAACDDFWRYLSVVVIPDVVNERYPDNDDHFWKKSNRIWLKCIWWYVFLSWNVDTETTKTILLGKNFNTDTLLQLVDRSGRNGTLVEVYRNIIKLYGTIDFTPLKHIYDEADVNAFRAIMKINTAKSLVVDPYLCDGGIEAYVKSLFKEININVL